MSGPLARCGPLSVLAVGLLAVVGSFFVRSWAVAAATVAVQGCLAALLVRGVPWSTVGRRLVPGLLAAGSVGFSSWLLGDHEPLTGVTAGLRVIALVLPGVLLLPLLDPSALGDHLAQRLRLPARPTVAAVSALQRLELLGQDWAELERARRSRGLGPGRSPVARVRHAGALTFGLLVLALRRAAQLAVAMDARGFARAARRSWAEPAPWLAADTALVTGGLLLAALPAVLSALLPA